jgi:hypothetical protein
MKTTSAIRILTRTGLMAIALGMFLLAAMTGCNFSKKTAEQAALDTVTQADTVNAEKALLASFDPALQFHIQKYYDPKLTSFTIGDYSVIVNKDTVSSYLFYITTPAFTLKQFIAVKTGKDANAMIKVYSCNGTCDCPLSYNFGNNTVTCTCTTGKNKNACELFISDSPAGK